MEVVTKVIVSITCAKRNVEQALSFVSDIETVPDYLNLISRALYLIGRYQGSVKAVSGPYAGSIYTIRGSYLGDDYSRNQPTIDSIVKLIDARVKDAKVLNNIELAAKTLATFKDEHRKAMLELKHVLSTTDNGKFVFL